MNYAEKLEELIKKQHGTVLSADLDTYEIPRVYLQMMVADGKLERVDRGVYVSTDSIEDEMFSMQTKYPKLIYSHETAFNLHGLSDRTPFEYSATVPSGLKMMALIWLPSFKPFLRLTIDHLRFLLLYYSYPAALRGRIRQGEKTVGLLELLADVLEAKVSAQARPLVSRHGTPAWHPWRMILTTLLLNPPLDMPTARKFKRLFR